MDDAERAQLGGAVIALLLAVLAKLRERARTGKRILPKMRLRASFSIRTPESDPPPRHEVEPEPDPENTHPVMLRRKNTRRRDAEDDG